MILLWSLFLFYQTPAQPVATPPPPTATQSSAISPAVKKALESQRKELELRLDKATFEASKPCIEWNLFVKTFFGFMGISFGTLIGYYFGFKKHVHTLITNKLTEEFKEKTDSWWAILGNYDQDKRLKEETRIHVLTAQSNYRMRMLLGKWGFKHVSVQAADAFLENPKPDDYDLLLFDALTSEEVNQILAVSPGKICVAYVPNGRLSIGSQDHINLANSLITLFTRTLEAARFQRDNQS